MELIGYLCCFYWADFTEDKLRGGLRSDVNSFSEIALYDGMLVILDELFNSRWVSN